MVWTKTAKWNFLHLKSSLFFVKNRSSWPSFLWKKNGLLNPKLQLDAVSSINFRLALRTTLPHNIDERGLSSGAGIVEKTTEFLPHEFIVFIFTASVRQILWYLEVVNDIDQSLNVRCTMVIPILHGGMAKSLTLYFKVAWKKASLWLTNLQCLSLNYDCPSRRFSHVPMPAEWR